MRNNVPVAHAGADRWLRQLLLYRYSVLLNQLKAQFPMTAEQEQALRNRILNHEWIKSAYTPES